MRLTHLRTSAMQSHRALHMIQARPFSVSPARLAKVSRSSSKAQPAFSAPRPDTSDEPQPSMPKMGEVQEEIAAPPVLHDGPSGQHPTGETAPVNKGEGRVAVNAGQEGNVSHVQSDLNVSDKSAVDESIGQNEENRGLGNFKSFAEKKAEEAVAATEEAASKASPMLQNISSSIGLNMSSLTEPIKGKGKASEFEFQNRPLNASEQNGLYVIGGIIVGGIVLGSVGKRSEPKKAKAAK